MTEIVSKQIRVLLWLCMAGLIGWMFFGQGKMIGGVEYFVHVGMGGAALAEVLMFSGALFLAWAIWVESPLTTRVAWAVAAIALVFWLSMLLPIPILRIFSPMILSSRFDYFLPLVIAGLAAYTASFPPLEKKP